jgi:hypothetical protein
MFILPIGECHVGRILVPTLTALSLLRDLFWDWKDGPSLVRHSRRSIVERLVSHDVSLGQMLSV